MRSPRPRASSASHRSTVGGVAHPPLIQREQLGPVADVVETATADLRARNALARLAAGDHTLWQDDPTEVADRLGWVPVVEEMRQRTGGLRTVAEAAWSDGLRHAVLLGCACLTDREFGEWAKDAWPRLSDAVLAT